MVSTVLVSLRVTFRSFVHSAPERLEPSMNGFDMKIRSTRFGPPGSAVAVGTNPLRPARSVALPIPTRYISPATNINNAKTNPKPTEHFIGETTLFNTYIMFTLRTSNIHLYDLAVAYAQENHSLAMDAKSFL
jgi:hypothetical protein